MIGLGQSTLGDGPYVLRSVTDPGDVLAEGGTAAREGDHEGLSPVAVQGGELADTTAPSGSVFVHVDAQTSTSTVDLQLRGRDDVSGVDTVRIANDGVTRTTVTSRTTARDVAGFSDSSLAAGTTYYYRVVATNGTGTSASSNVASVTTTSAPAPPAAPSNLQASESGTTATLTWIDNATTETGYVVERSLSPAFSAPTNTLLPAGTTRFTDAGLSAGTTYYYRVKATNAAGDSPWSGSATATPVAAPAASAYATAVTADGPVGYWRLGEAGGTNAADQRTANPGTYLGSPGLGAASLLAGDAGNTAVRFDGADDAVRVPSSGALGFGTAFSLEAWIQLERLPATGGWASVVSKGESYSLQFNGPRLEFMVIQNGTRRRLLAPSGAIAAGGVYHVVGTYDGATQSLYVNGTQVASARLTGAATVTANPLHIGSWDGAGEFFADRIDEVAVYDRALTAAQVSNHRTTGLG